MGRCRKLASGQPCFESENFRIWRGFLTGTWCVLKDGGFFRFVHLADALRFLGVEGEEKRKIQRFLLGGEK